MQIAIAADGTTRFIHNDVLDAKELGAANIQRASHVEPNDDLTLNADLTPVNGPVLGPFPTRAAALAAEVAWLERNWL